MFKLGLQQKLMIDRETKIGVYLTEKNVKDDESVLLPVKQVPKDAKVGDEIQVFLYKDSEDRLIATTKTPKVTIGEIAKLRVVETTKIGAFLDWGLDKDLLMPFKEQLGKITKGESYLIGLYVDHSERLCATMKVAKLLGTNSPYKVGDKVEGTVYNVQDDFGAFIAVDNKYQGLIPNKELYGNYRVGEVVKVRINNVKNDGRLELSIRNKAYSEIEQDSKKIMNSLQFSGGKMNLNDKSSPEIIKKELNMSKSAFKRAVGRLLKEGAIKITPKGIERNW